MLKIVNSSNTRAVARLVEPSTTTRNAARERRVAAIIRDVRRNGDGALLRLARDLDGLDAPVEVTAAEMRDALASLPRELRRSLQLAARNIRSVARRQLPRPWRMAPMPGVTLQSRVVPIDRVGCYVPAGRYPLPSSLLMTAVPARVAGVREIVVACPRPAPVVLAAAALAGVDRMFRLGGAHAVAALAYGTRRVPRVDKIVGPGSAWVATAKALVSTDCAIDFHAGPSEITVVSARGRADWIAADLIAQAEHDPDARAILITPSRRLAQAVAGAVQARLPRTGPAATALARRGGAIVTKTLAEAVALANRIAPEHLVADDERVIRGVRRAGTIFAGAWSAQAAGDYATGSNHVLPTGGAAAARGGLGAADFVRLTIVQRLTRRGIRAIGPAAVTLARAEGLGAHAASIEARLA